MPNADVVFLKSIDIDSIGSKLHAIRRVFVFTLNHSMRSEQPTDSDVARLSQHLEK